MNSSLDILMVTYNRPQYTRLALPQLLATCDQTMRVWVWHNGTDRETLDVVQAHRSHPRFFRFHHAPENAKLSEATDWLWSQADGGLVGKVDDDCLVPADWYRPLRAAHHDFPRFGALGCWGFFRPEDFNLELAMRKIRIYPGGHSILRHPWIGGNSFVMKRACVLTNGLLRPGETFPNYCLRLAWSGWVNGLYYPPIFVDHMDDPRSPHTLLRTDADMEQFAPLTAVKNRITTVRAWQQTIQDVARTVQTGRVAPCRFFWIRGLPFRLAGAVRRRHAVACARGVAPKTELAASKT